MKKYWELAELENEFFFESAIVNIFFHIPLKNRSNFLGQQGWVEILMITLISSPKQHLPKDMQHSVLILLIKGETL